MRLSAVTQTSCRRSKMMGEGRGRELESNILTGMLEEQVAGDCMAMGLQVL